MPRRSVYSIILVQNRRLGCIGMAPSRTPQCGAKAVYVDSSRTKQAAFFSPLPPILLPRRDFSHCPSATSPVLEVKTFPIPPKLCPFKPTPQSIPRLHQSRIDAFKPRRKKIARARDGWDHKMGGTDDGRRARPSFCDGEHCTTYYVRTEMCC